MKKILANSITLIGEIVALILGVLWFVKTKEFEPLILIVVAISTLIASLLLRNSGNPKLDLTIELNGKGKKPTIPSKLTPTNSEGMPVMQIGNIVGKRELFWKYKLVITNNSEKNAYKPHLYIKKPFEEYHFIGELNSTSPIKSTENVELNFEFSKWTDGTKVQREEDYKPNFPTEFQSDFSAVIQYENEDGHKIFNQLIFKNGKIENEKLKKINSDFQIAKIYNL